MSDDFESLEQRWRTSRRVADDGEYLAALIASGKLSKERVAMAAALGHAGALASGVDAAVLAFGGYGNQSAT